MATRAVFLVLVTCAFACAPSTTSRGHVDARSVEQEENERANEEARQRTIERNAAIKEEKAKQDDANIAAMDQAVADDDESAAAWAKIDVDACALRAEDKACLEIDQFLRDYPSSSKRTEAKAAADKGAAVRGQAYDQEAAARLDRLKAKNKEREKARAADEKHWNEQLKK